MYAQVEKSKENKSRAVANSLIQKKSEVKQGFGFVDNRPEAAIQRKLQHLMNNHQQTKQLQDIHKQGNTKVNGSIVQLKPNNISNHRNTLTMVGTVGGEPTIVNASANRAARSVAYPINSMIELGIIGSSDAPLTGGHLFKAEYGGQDDITNVVPWNADAETKYSTFENAYNRHCSDRARENGGQQATIDVVATAKFGSDSIKRKEVANILRGVGESEKGDAKIRSTISSLVQYSSESVPTSVEAFAEVNGRRVPDLKYKNTKLIDKKDLTGLKVRELFESVKQNGWTGRARNSIEKLSEWEVISE